MSRKTHADQHFRDPENIETARAECAGRLAMTSLLVRDAGAGWTGERQDVYLPEACLFAPCGEVGAREVKRVAELDQHVERHEEAERVFAAGVVDDVLDDDVGPALRQRVVGRLDQLLLPLEVPVVRLIPIVVTSASGSGSPKKSPPTASTRSLNPAASIVRLAIGSTTGRSRWCISCEGAGWRG
jgi:hypothetical protein